MCASPLLIEVPILVALSTREPDSEITGIKIAAMLITAIRITASFFFPPNLSASFRNSGYIATALIPPQAIREINGESICRHQARIRKIRPSRIAISMAWVV